MKRRLGRRLFWKNMQKTDANIVLRYILNDHAELSLKAKEIIEQYNIEITIEVLCEIVYVLTGHYKIGRQIVSTELVRFIKQTGCTISHKEVVFQAFNYFKDTAFDFVDCILAAYAKIDNDKILTFDYKLQKLIAEIKN